MKNYFIFGLLAAILVVALFGSPFSTTNLGAEGDTNLTNLVLSGDLTVGDDSTFTDDVAVTGDLTAGTVTSTGDLTVEATGTTTIGGGVAIDFITRDTFTWDSGEIINGYSSSTAFLFDASPLPAVGDDCVLGLGTTIASTTEPIIFTARITAADSTTASGTLHVVNYGVVQDFGASTLSITCFNY